MVSVRRVAPVLLLVMALPALAKTTPKSSTHPPRELHRVGDHWTPYNPPDPSTYPPAAKTYTIKAGDTLWALAQQFYNNAYLWPQLWEGNTWVTDAHWIYPGDVLLVEGETSAGAAVSTNTATASGGNASSSNADQHASDTAALPTVTMSAAASPIPLATEADLYCYGYIGDPHESMPNHIDSFEDVEMTYHKNVLEQTDTVSIGDLVYIAGGTSTGIVPGETYLIVLPGEMVNHPRTQKAVGRHYEFRGQVRILCSDETRSRGIITQSCREIPRGARLKPMPQLPIPIARVPDVPAFCDASSGKLSGSIVQSDGFQVIIGVGNLVQVDLGRDDQLQPGDFLTVFRESPEPGQPRQVLGEIGVLTTENHTATGRVVAMRRAMEVGDKVEAR
jgi:LysM domain-containing protein